MAVIVEMFCVTQEVYQYTFTSGHAMKTVAEVLCRNAAAVRICRRPEPGNRR